MENYCAFSKNHKCILWTDYEITREELSECHTLCHETGVYDSLSCPSPATLDYQHTSIKIYST